MCKDRAAEAREVLNLIIKYAIEEFINKYHLYDVIRL